MQKILKAITATGIALMALSPLQSAFAQDLTIKEVHVVDGKDGVTPVTEPYEGQVMQANLLMSDDSWIYSYPENANIIYTWYDANTGATLGSDSSFTYTSDNVGMAITLDVEYMNNGEIVTWSLYEEPQPEAPVAPQTGDESFGGFAGIESLLQSIF